MTKKTSGNFHESYNHEHPNMPTEQSTGRVFAGVAVIIGALMFYSSDYTNYQALFIALGIAIIFLALSQFAPIILRPLNIAWFKFSTLLFKIMNPLMMLIMFVIVIVPAGLIMQLKSDPLGRKKGRNNDSETTTYWTQVTPEQSTRSMKNQF